jgi:hypothetical protein
VIIKHTTISYLRGCNCNNDGHSDKEGQEEVGGGIRQQKVVEEDIWGACNCSLNAANTRTKEAAQRRPMKDTLDVLHLPV